MTSLPGLSWAAHTDRRELSRRLRLASVIETRSHPPYSAHRRRTACFLVSLCVGTLALASCDTRGGPAPPPFPYAPPAPARTGSHAKAGCPISPAEIKSPRDKPVQPPEGDATE